MKNFFEAPSIEMESLQANEAIMNEYWGDDPFALGAFASAANV